MKSCGFQGAIEDQLAAIRASMCVTCPHSEKEQGKTVRCTIDGRDLRAVVYAPFAACPHNRWPDRDGIVTWKNRQWWGTPDPLRWLLLFKLGRDPGVGGCGCSVKLKAGKLGRWLSPWMAISGELRRWLSWNLLPGWRDTRSAFMRSPDPKPVEPMKLA